MDVWGTAHRCGSSPYEGHPGGGVRANEEKGHRPKNRAKDEKSAATFLQGGDHRRMCYMSNTPIVKDAETGRHIGRATEINRSEATTHLAHRFFYPSSEGGDAGQFLNFIVSGDSNPSYKNLTDLAYEATLSDSAIENIGNS